jgi:hypothetical protein
MPLTVRPVPSGPLYVPLEQLAIPDVASVPDVVHATAWLYQPFESAARPKAVDADGAVASYLNVAEAAAADTLPALSVHVPLTVRPVPSGPLYVPLEQLAIPDVASVPDVVQATAWLYQPFESAARPNAVDAEGAVLSIFRVTESVELPPALCAVQLEVTEAVSVVKFCVPQPLSITAVDSASVTVHATVTLLLNQPLVPAVPVTVFVITGGVVSVTAV